MKFLLIHLSNREKKKFFKCYFATSFLSQFLEKLCLNIKSSFRIKIEECLNKINFSTRLLSGKLIFRLSKFELGKKVYYSKF